MDDRLKEFEKELVELYGKGYDNYDKKLSYLSASSIGVSMVFLKDIVGDIDECRFKYLLAIAWILLSITLIINLFSHTYLSKKHNETLAEIRSNNYNPENAMRRNKQIERVNDITNVAFCLGLFTLVVFVIINLKIF